MIASWQSALFKNLSYCVLLPSKNQDSNQKNLCRGCKQTKPTKFLTTALNYFRFYASLPLITVSRLNISTKVLL